MAGQAKNKTVKKRFWTFILYPESAPADWRDQMILSGVQFAVSPLHDNDLDIDDMGVLQENEDGTPKYKKAHYHIILVWDGPTTYENAERFTKKLNGTIPLPLESIRGMYDYFTHKNNPEKAQYKIDEIGHFNGFAVSNLIALTREETRKNIHQIIGIILANEYTDYSQVYNHLVECEFYDCEYVLRTNTFFFQTYITSRRHLSSQNVVDTRRKPYKIGEQGEVVDLTCRTPFD